MKKTDKSIELEVLEELKKTWQDAKMLKYCLVNNYYHNIKDKYLIFKNKITIDSKLYYNDETTPPEVTRENFINHNLHWNFYNEFGLNFEDDLYLCPLYTVDSRIVYLKTFQLPPQNKNNLILISSEEKKEIKVLIDNFKNEYIQRLEIYWKKYKNKIHTQGYWADR